jgi:hypothetical protein
VLNGQVGTSSIARGKILKLTRVGFEPTPPFGDEKPAIAGKLSLESHAIDRSAILPYAYR